MIQLGVIGYGSRIAHFVTHSLGALPDEFRIVGVVDPDEAGARKRMRDADRADAVFYPSVQEMARQARLDGWLIGTRCNTHADLAVEVSRYDLPLFLEKPVAVDMAQAQRLEEAFERSRCEVVVSFPLRVSPLCERARELIAQGAVGQPQHVHAVNYVPYGRVYWEDVGYRNYQVTRGLFLQKATHDFDYISHLMGSPIVRVAAMASYGRVFGGDKPVGLMCSGCDEQDTCMESPRNRSRYSPSSAALTRDHLCLFSTDCGTPETGTNEDCSSALLEFANGSHGVYSQVFFARHEAAARGATVSGYKGTVAFDWYEGVLRHVRHFSPFADTSRAGEKAAHFGGDVMLARNFLDVVRRGERSRTPIQAGLQSVYACLAAKASAQSGRFEAVRQLGGGASQAST